MQYLDCWASHSAPRQVPCFAGRDRGGLISERTKAGLAAAKRRGKKLGGRNAQSDKAAAEALAFAERMRPILAEMKALSANRAAAALHERGITTAAGSKWTAVRVIRVRRCLQGD